MSPSSSLKSRAHKKSLWLTATAIAFTGGLAYAADSNFDEAISNLNKAVALVKAAEIPKPAKGKSTPAALAERHRKRAIALMERAKDRIECAKQAADGKRVILCKDNDD